MSARAMMVSLFKTLHRFVQQRHAADCGRRREKEKKDKKTKKAMFGTIPSPGPDVVLALLSFPLQRKHTLIQTM